MYTRKSRLNSYKQSRLIEHFVAGTTARAAAQIIGVRANTTITFFREKSKQTKVISVVFAKANEVEALRAKSLFLGY